MRRFRFRLESALGWRRVRLELEESKLQELYAELSSRDARIAGLERDRAEVEQTVLGANIVDAGELGALDLYRRHLQREKERLTRERTECERRIAAQRELVLGAERDVLLLEKVRERRLHEWQREADREQEVLAAEAFLAEWSRQKSWRD